MSKLVVLNTKDEQMLERALKMDAELLLMQDAVLFANNRIEANNRLAALKVYAVKRDAVKRGLSDRLLDNVELVDTDELVDLLFSGKSVVNL
ncbi:MAG: DsrH/TusB family sulfur relay protein [Candidatus Bathyarchaeota archaeon]|nr:DsrH/TusB family sulfur relay protein [Candidatus Bathyarchaeota archaeon]